MDKYGYTLVNLIRYLFGYTNLDIFRITNQDIQRIISGYIWIYKGYVCGDSDGYDRIECKDIALEYTDTYG